MSAGASSAGLRRFEAPPGERLRVAIFSDAAAGRNGVGTYYADLVEHLRDHVDAAELFCPRFSDGVWHNRVALPLPGDSTQRIVVPNLRELSRRVEEIAPHTVILPTPGPYGMYGLRLARRAGARVVVGFHTHYEHLTDMYWTTPFGKLCRWYLETCNRILFRCGSIVLANSEEMAGIARTIGAREVRLMGTFIPREFLHRPVEPLAPELSRVLFAGRLAPEKNVQAIIAAAEQLPELTFRIAGDGPLRGEVERRAAELANLHYLGWVTRDDVLPLLDDSDMLVLPSHVESFGTIALEGMARNRTVLVSARCGILDWQSLGQGLFRIGEDESLAAAIRRVAGLDHAIRGERARVGREAARQLNRWSLGTWLQTLGRGLDA